ncbi:MAG: hypothetical protein GY803_30795 [Chloroflexi bacterium]|nr:hypothetical protein [Chloroflexota bacterium]
MSHSRRFVAENETERLVLYILRRAKADSKRRRRPQTYVIRVVDGIVQIMEAEPISRDLRNIDGHGPRR